MRDNKRRMNKVRMQVIGLCLVAALLFTGVQMEGQAAARRTMALVTAVPCSVWSAPNTNPENRIKFIPEQYVVNVYPVMIPSNTGDGKLFYQTSKGAYILCKCFATVGEGLVKSNGKVLDVTPPTLDALTMSADAASCEAGDKIHICVKASDDMSGVLSGYLSLRENATGRELQVKLVQGSNGLLFGTITVDKNTPKGIYLPRLFTLTDKAGNTLFTTADASVFTPGLTQPLPDKVGALVLAVGK